MKTIYMVKIAKVPHEQLYICKAYDANHKRIPHCDVEETDLAAAKLTAAAMLRDTPNPATSQYVAAVADLERAGQHSLF